MLPLVFISYIFIKENPKILLKKILQSWLFWLYLYIVLNNIFNGVAFGDKEIELKLFSYLILSVSVYYFMIMNIISFRNIIYLIIGITLIHALNGYWQLCSGADLFLDRILIGNNVRGAVENQNVFGFILLIAAMCSTYFLFYNSQNKTTTTLFLIVITFIFITLIIQTNSRNAFISYMLYISLQFFYMYKIRKKLFLFYDSIFMLCIFSYMVFFGKLLMLRLDLSSKNADSGRFEIWTELFEKAIQNPMFGSGLQAPYFLEWGRVLYPHNLTIEIFLSFGFVGIALFSILITVFFMKLAKAKILTKAFVVPVFVTLFGFYLQFGPSMFIHSVVAPYVFVLLGIMAFLVKTKPSMSLSTKFNYNTNQ